MISEMIKNIAIILMFCLVFSGFVQAGYRMDTVAATPHVAYPLGLAIPAIKASQSFIATGSFIYGFYFYANKVGSPSNYLITILRSSLTGADIKYHNWSPLLMLPAPHWYTWADSVTVVSYSSTYYFIYETLSVSPTNYFIVYTDNTNPYASGQFYYSTADVPYPTNDALIAIIYYVNPNGGPCYVNADCESNHCVTALPPLGVCTAVSASDPSTTGLTPPTAIENVPTDFSQTTTAGTNPLSCYAFEFGDASPIYPFSSSTPGIKTLSHTYASTGTYNTMTKVCDNSGGVCTNEAVPAGCYKINSTVVVSTVIPGPIGYCETAGNCNYGYNCNKETHTCYPRSQDYARWGDFYQELFLNWNTFYVVAVVAIILFGLMVVTLRKSAED